MFVWFPDQRAPAETVGVFSIPGFELFISGFLFLVLCFLATNFTNREVRLFLVSFSRFWMAKILRFLRQGDIMPRPFEMTEWVEFSIQFLQETGKNHSN